MQQRSSFILPMKAEDPGYYDVFTSLFEWFSWFTQTIWQSISFVLEMSTFWVGLLGI